MNNGLWHERIVIFGLGTLVGAKVMHCMHVSANKEKKTADETDEESKASKKSFAVSNK
jgi:hypothetical protein